jgi:hypothetical protein
MHGMRHVGTNPEHDGAVMNRRECTARKRGNTGGIRSLYYTTTRPNNNTLHIYGVCDWIQNTLADGTLFRSLRVLVCDANISIHIHIHVYRGMVHVPQ